MHSCFANYLSASKPRTFRVVLYSITTLICRNSTLEAYLKRPYYNNNICNVKIKTFSKYLFTSLFFFYFTIFIVFSRLREPHPNSYICVYGCERQGLWQINRLFALLNLQWYWLHGWMANCLLTGLRTCKSDSNIYICIYNHEHCCMVAVKICSLNGVFRLYGTVSIYGPKYM